MLHDSNRERFEFTRVYRKISRERYWLLRKVKCRLEFMFWAPNAFCQVGTCTRLINTGKTLGGVCFCFVSFCFFFFFLTSRQHHVESRGLVLSTTCVRVRFQKKIHVFDSRQCYRVGFKSQWSIYFTRQQTLFFSVRSYEHDCTEAGKITFRFPS